MSTVLRTESLGKNYGKVQALQQLSLEVPQGAVFGLLGPNGSGKTTLLSIILGIIKPGSGRFEWGTGKIGALLEKPNFLDTERIGRQLYMHAVLRYIPKEERDERIAAVLQQTGLYEARHKPFRSLSLGMKQRLALAAVLLPNPDILILDEPTNGLDPQGIVDVRKLIQALATQGRTIILASHMLDEIEKVCTHAAILKKGELVRVEEINQPEIRQELTLVLGTEAEHIAKLQDALTEWAHCIQSSFGEEAGTLIAVFTPEAGKASDINRKLAEQGIYLSMLKTHHTGLEASFLEAVGGAE